MVFPLCTESQAPSASRRVISLQKAGIGCYSEGPDGSNREGKPFITTKTEVWKSLPKVSIPSLSPSSDCPNLKETPLVEKLPPIQLASQSTELTHGESNRILK